MLEANHRIYDDGGVESPLREWSSLIGIITAIVGNILISFALNIQRYAHIRLGREQERENAHWNGGQKKSGQRHYGTQQSVIAEERARLNLTAPSQDDEASIAPSQATGNAKRVSADQMSLNSHSSSESTIKPSEKPRLQADRKTYLRSPYWWGGIILMTIGEAGNFLAYGFAPASIVSPLGVVALVSNCIIAPCLLKERFRQRDFWGVAIAIGGAVTIVLSAKNSETKMGPGDLWTSITRWEFELYLGITAGVIIILMWASGRYGERTILIDLGLVGLFGGYTALSTKGVASLLSDTLWRALTFPITYALILVLVSTALMQIRYVNCALQRFDSTQVIPVQFVMFTISVIVGSAILYRDFKSATGDRIGKFVGGCILTFLGVYLITSGREPDETEGDDGNVEDEENAIGLVDGEPYQDDIYADNEVARKKRTSLVSIAFDDTQNPNASSRLSHRKTESRDLSPRTPLRKQSNTSSASSRASGKKQESDLPPMDSPWRSHNDGPIRSARPPPLENTISSPLLPSEAQRLDPRYNDQHNPSISTPGRPSTLSRPSMARLTPGPFMSPLSSSLSAVVADSIRRGPDSPLSRKRPRLPGQRKSRSQRATVDSSGATAGLSPLKGAQPPEEAVDTEDPPPRKARSQSVNATLGELFRLKRERNKGKSDDREGNEDEH